MKLTVKKDKKILYQDFGEMLFTHFGITGPLVLSASAQIGDVLKKRRRASGISGSKAGPYPGAAGRQDPAGI